YKPGTGVRTVASGGFVAHPCNWVGGRFSVGQVFPVVEIGLVRLVGDHRAPLKFRLRLEELLKALLRDQRLIKIEPLAIGSGRLNPQGQYDAAGRVRERLRSSGRLRRRRSGDGSKRRP